MSVFTKWIDTIPFPDSYGPQILIPYRKQIFRRKIKCEKDFVGEKCIFYGGFFFFKFGLQKYSQI